MTMSEVWNCADCGKPLLPGERIVHSAAGEVGEEGGFEMGDHFYMHAECPTDDDDDTPSYTPIIVCLDGGVIRYLEAWVNQDLAWRRFKMLCEDYGIEDWEEDEAGVVEGIKAHGIKSLQVSVSMFRLEWVHSEWPEHWRHINLLEE